MYTQCPDCQIAFRVTAAVLQQAGGNVRCGGCGHAFNALEFLSEEMPDTVAIDTGDGSGETADELAETSRRLLATLDELAGPEDVRIEDTGVEWRVLDEAAAADVKLPPEQLPPKDERRYDDNTPLPDEFDDDEVFSAPETPLRREEDQQPKSGEFEERQGDLALSEPEEWTDILLEVRDPNTESLEVEEELAAIHNELSAIDDALTDEVPQLDEIELGDLEDDVLDEIEAELINQIEADAVAELAISAGDDDSVEEEDLADDADTGVFDALIEVDEEESDEENVEEDVEYEEDVEFEVEDAADDSAEVEDEDEEDLDAGNEADELSFERESTGEFDAQIDDAARAFASGDDEPSEAEEELGDEEEEFEEVPDTGTDSDEDWLDEIESAETDERDDDDEADDLDDQEDQDDQESEIDEDPENDEDELAAAEEKFDFAATIVGMENPEDLFDESSGEVETIIMEGDFIRSEVEDERMAAEHSARSELDDPASLMDTYALNRGKVRGGRRNYDPPSIVLIGAIVGLSLILAGQLVHNSRQSLATSGFFNSTIAPVYRLLGNPVTPDWDVNGWQFEATNGSVEEEETELTIVSRIANGSSQTLPYPLIHVSLTNRFEDVMGSAILEPGEYLASDADPSRLIEPGDNFTAVITVDDPSVDATGFKLYVCYRVEPGTVKCADHDFKN